MSSDLAEEVAGADCGTTGLKLLSTLLTLLTVADGCVPDLPVLKSADGISSAGVTPGAFELFLPKLSFHFEDFFVGTGAADMGEDGRGGKGGTGGTGEREERKVEGTPYADDGGSKTPHGVEDDEELAGTDLFDDVLEFRLISRANDCASVANSSSLGVVGVAAEVPLPFLPRFRRL